MTKPHFRDFRRITIKVGSSLLVDAAQGRLKETWLAALCDDIAALYKSGADVLVVSSGAIALGRSVLKLPKGALKLEESQGAAAVGQIALAKSWADALGKHGITAGQILLTLGDTEERRRYLNARETLARLLEWRAIPVVNENDTVATTEIRYGDNDRLAARVATMASADLLVLLSDVDGLYTAPPQSDPNAILLPIVPRITAEIEAMAGGAASELSRGGMRTKIEAAKIATLGGTQMVIADGRVMNPIKSIIDGGRCAWFTTPSNPVAARKKWIAGVLEPKGALHVDAGAARAIRDGKSLLSAGIKNVEGTFERGDVVLLRAPDGEEIGRGLAAYDAAEAHMIAGRSSRDIEAILGFAGRAEMVHRDDMTLSDIEMSALVETMFTLGQQARLASRALALTSGEKRVAGLRAAAQSLRNAAPDILTANLDDCADAVARGTKGAFLDRLTLDNNRLEAIARAVEEVAALADPVGRILASWTQPNGLQFERVATPLGVIGVIFESRPNVTADAAALGVKSGNAVILRAGSESFRTSSAIAGAMRAGLRREGLSEDVIQLVPTRDRDAVGLMLRGLNGAIDVIVPRGGRSLVARVQDEARVPVFAHLEGLCHVYVDSAADLEMARAIVKNAKLRRTGICGAAETLLVDRACAQTHLMPLVTDLIDAGCEVRGDAMTQSIDTRVKPATDDDWATEYLDAIIACRVVDGLDGALAHIARWSSHHTDCIITSDIERAERFLKEVDSAIVLHNASTQFADGGEFGFGAEIGIATGRMHARGPVGIEQLTSFNYRVRGSGQVRP